MAVKKLLLLLLTGTFIQASSLIWPCSECCGLYLNSGEYVALLSVKCSRSNPYERLRRLFDRNFLGIRFPINLCCEIGSYSS